MPPMNSPRRRAMRAVLSALAGGGLTAASLGGPLSGGALGATVPTGTATPPEGTPSPVTTGSPGAQETTAAPPSNTTPTTPPPPPSPSGTSTASHASTPPAAGAAPEAPTVVLQNRQKTTPARRAERHVRAKHAEGNVTTKPAKPAKPARPATGTTVTKGVGSTSGHNNVAPPPQLVAGQAGAVAGQLASSAASAQALAFYRIPLFLLPIYQAAAVQYGVPWQILAAINEIETDYGNNQSVSTAGAVGWMQFMPATWAQYGVDALNAGYADPYNPVDAVFAAARYLRAAGAAQDLRAAILAYNHSEEYADSVLLRAKLISTYPRAAIATLTGLVDDRLPVTGTQIGWGSLLPSPSSATANAVSAPGRTPAPAPTSPTAGSTGSSAGSSPKRSVTSGSSAPPAPAVAAALATGSAGSGAQAAQLVDVLSARNAEVVAAQDGRIVKLGNSRKLGKYVILRDVYGDVFTYSGLGSIAPTYRLPKLSRGPVKAPVANGAGAFASAPQQLPLTLHVKTPPRHVSAPPAATEPGQESTPEGSAESTPAGMGQARLFAHPGNPDAVAAAAAAAGRAGRSVLVGHPLPLRGGSVVAEGTVLGRVRVPLGAKDGHLRFAIRPAGDPGTIDPRPILANWVQLDAALHPQGARGESNLLGATAGEVLLMSQSRLEREILSDPGIAMSACSRHEVASGLIDKRVLAALAFLSRSGLKPTVGTTRCGASAHSPGGYLPAKPIADAVTISEINGVPVAGHQGSGSITDATIRTLLTLRGEFIPHRIVSLMQYPDAPATLARPDHADHIEVDFSPGPKLAPNQASIAPTATVAHSAGAGKAAPSPLIVTGEISATEWDQLIARIAALPAPKVSTQPSSSAIPDPKRG